MRVDKGTECVNRGMEGVRRGFLYEYMYMHILLLWSGYSERYVKRVYRVRITEDEMLIAWDGLREVCIVVRIAGRMLIGCTML